MQKPGCCRSALAEVVDSLIKKDEGRLRQPRKRDSASPAVILCLYSLIHNLKKVADRYDALIVFSARNKLSQMCRKINNFRNSTDSCDTKHYNRFTECTTGLVYESAMSCRSSYIGHTGRYFINHKREHAAPTRRALSGHLATHCSLCSCALGPTL